MTLTTLRRVAQIFVFLRHDCAKLKRINKQTIYEKKMIKQSLQNNQKIIQSIAIKINPWTLRVTSI